MVSQSSETTRTKSEEEVTEEEVNIEDEEEQEVNTEEEEELRLEPEVVLRLEQEAVKWKVRKKLIRRSLQLETKLLLPSELQK